MEVAAKWVRGLRPRDEPVEPLTSKVFLQASFITCLLFVDLERAAVTRLQKGGSSFGKGAIKHKVLPRRVTCDYTMAMSTSNSMTTQVIGKVRFSVHIHGSLGYGL